MGMSRHKNRLLVLQSNTSKKHNLDLLISRQLKAHVSNSASSIEKYLLSISFFSNSPRRSHIFAKRCCQSNRSVVGTPAAHSSATTPVRAGVTVRAAGISGFARRLRSETVPRARELRRRGSATVTVGARRRGKTSATPVVLHGDRVVLRAVVARRAVGAVGVGVLLVGAAAGADGADEGGEEEDAADDDDGNDDALVHACFGGGVAGVKGVEVVGWGGGAGVEGCAAGGCSAAVGCAHGTGALLDSAHDSGGGGHVEAGYRGVGGVGGSSGAGNSRVVAAGVHHVKMHVGDGGVFVVSVVV